MTGRTHFKGEVGAIQGGGKGFNGKHVVIQGGSIMSNDHGQDVPLKIGSKPESVGQRAQKGAI
jgi:hypothetical protein